MALRESQEHGSKKINEIDASQIKDGDRVICFGTWDKDGPQTDGAAISLPHHKETNCKGDDHDQHYDLNDIPPV